MKKIQILIAALAITMTADLSAQNYAVGDGVIVAANSGLRLRVKPSLQAPTIKVLDYDTPLDIVELGGPATRQRIQWFDGEWLKVKAGFVSGWVFDGFVSSLPAPSHEAQLCVDCYSLLTPLREYLFDNFKIECSVEPIDSTEDAIQSDYIFAGGIILNESSDDGWYRSEILFERHRMSEVVSLLRALLVGNAMRSDFEDTLVFHENKAGKVDRIDIKLFNDDLRIIDSGNGILVSGIVLTPSEDFHVVNE